MRKRNLPVLTITGIFRQDLHEAFNEREVAAIISLMRAEVKLNGRRLHQPAARAEKVVRDYSAAFEDVRIRDEANRIYL